VTVHPPDDPHTREAVIAAHGALGALVKRYHVRYKVYIPDLVLFGLSLDVLEQTRAVVTLTDAGLGRPAITNARAAFESAIDMLVLVASPQDYCRLGALARAAELVDAEHLHIRRERADKVLQLDRSIEHRSPESVVAEEAAFWEHHRPGATVLYQEALSKVRDEELWKKHWSGLTRKQIRETVAGISPDPVGVAEMIDAMYGVQSAHAHPSPRFGMRDITIEAEGTPIVGPRDVDIPAALGFATLSLTLATIAVGRRPTPHGG